MTDNTAQTVTLDQARSIRLLDRIASQERRHSEELVDLELQYLVQIEALSNQVQELTRQLQAYGETPVKPEQASFTSAKNGTPPRKVTKKKAPASKKK